MQADSTTTTHTFDGLLSGTDYVAQVEAANEAGTRDKPAQISFTTEGTRKYFRF